jgi:hypothetical protein
VDEPGLVRLGEGRGEGFAERQRVGDRQRPERGDQFRQGLRAQFHPDPTAAVGEFPDFVRHERGPQLAQPRERAQFLVELVAGPAIQLARVHLEGERLAGRGVHPRQHLRDRALAEGHQFAVFRVHHGRGRPCARADARLRAGVHSHSRNACPATRPAWPVAAISAPQRRIRRGFGRECIADVFVLDLLG